MSANEPDSSALRAFSILEYIASAEEPVTLDALTQLSGLPKPTVHRILALLIRGRLVDREAADKRYSIGPRLSDLALRVQVNSPQRARRHVILARLVEEIGETCNFTMPDGAEAVYLDRVETSSPVRLHMEPGSRVPLHCTASGKVFLAQMNGRQRRQLLGEGPFKRYTERTITDLSTLERELAKVRDEGVGIDISEYLEGSVCLAVPVTDARGRVCATVAVHGPSPRMSLEKGRGYLPALRRAASAMAETLASEPPNAATGKARRAPARSVRTA